ncbi:MAG: hypothetical protein ABI585_06385 [Betaproteobacteria bacterium]
MAHPIRNLVSAVSAATATLAATPAHAALLDLDFSTLSWNVWLGIASGLLLVVGIVIAASHRTNENETSAYQAPRREPMPLYEEGASS